MVGSNPSGGAACAPGSTADRNVGLCPNGRTITVTFKPSFADWRSLLHQHRPRAHRPRRSAGTPASSARRRRSRAAGTRSPSYNENQSVVLIRNPTYWGTPAKLDKIVFQFFSDDTQLVPALQNKEVNIINPATVNLSIVQTANQVPSTTKVDDPGPRVRALRLQRGRPVSGQAAGP